METFNFNIYIGVIPSLMCLAICFFTVLEKKKNKVLSQKLLETAMRLEVTTKKLDNLQGKKDRSSVFHNSLQVAELTTKLQKPRLEAGRNARGPSSGKYSSVPSLAEEGLCAEEIATVLAISPHEAMQLVNLAKLAQGKLGHNVAN